MQQHRSEFVSFLSTAFAAGLCGIAVIGIIRCMLLAQSICEADTSLFRNPRLQEHQTAQLLTWARALVVALILIILVVVARQLPVDQCPSIRGHTAPGRCPETHGAL